MRWRLMLSVLLGMALGSSRESASAQDNALNPPRNSADRFSEVETGNQELGDEPSNQPVPSALVLSTQVAKFQMILGRLSLDPPAHIKCERSAELSCGGDERVEVTASRGIPSLHYHLSTSRRKLTVDVKDAEHVRIESEVTDDYGWEKLQIDQPADGKIHLSLTTVDELTKEKTEQDIQVPSFIHFKISYPSVYKRHVAPMFSRLLERPQATCDAIALLDALDTASPDEHTLHETIDGLVEMLGSPSRESRNRAEKELRTLGLPALCLIDMKLHNARDLDVEQRMRLRRVRGAIKPKLQDSPRQLAKWLASDINYWNIVAGNLSLAELRAIQNDVLSVTGQTIRPELRVADASGNR